MKYYLFRDLEHQSNLKDGKTFHAHGLVTDLFVRIGFPYKSVKDACIEHFKAFDIEVDSEWSSFDEVELLDISKEEYIKMSNNLEFLEKVLTTTN